MTPTPNQQRAINEPGNLLVVAAAGAGKTGTLVQRCTRLLLDPAHPVPIRQILVVTFTEAAAAEVRHRIRAALEKAAAERPDDERLRDQLAQIDSAYITTLHAFCFELVRRHTLELGLDPAISVLEPQEARVIFYNTLDLLLQEHYSRSDAFSIELRELIRSHFAGWDKGVREFVEAVHEHTQTRFGPGRWFDETSQSLERDRCPEWHDWYLAAVKEWCRWWLPYLQDLPPENLNGAACARILEDGCAKSDLHVLRRILERDTLDHWDGRKKQDRPAINKLFDEASFLASLRPEKPGEHPLDQDWAWMRKPFLVLVQLAREFAERFASAKEELGKVDFHDLEQFALRLLVDGSTRQPTALAREWQRKFKAVFVDEYQDINSAQDVILSALSTDTPGNRFLVGDMKQSIYRFRQADPRIFRNYLNKPGWQTVTLSENFRSHQGVLEFVNPIFTWLMHNALGGVEYDEDAALRFGAPENRAAMARVAGEPPPVELHLLITNENDDFRPNETEGDLESIELEDAEVEARLVAARFRELKDRGVTIWDQKAGELRPVEWKDMVVLLRAAKGKLETYAKAFAAAGVPLQTKRNAFFTTQEVLDLVNVLTILDNPLQDIPVAGVLRSPIVGLTANELAAVRIHSREKFFWRAARKFVRDQVKSSALPKLQKFLGLVDRWRDPRTCSSLSQRLEAILVDTGYGDWLRSQDRGRERYANVRQLLRMALQFDETRGQSLYLFLRYLEEMQDANADIEPAVAVEENAVRLMTVHQSKGLEFPVVAVADLGKRFNFGDLTRSVVIHDEFGLCSMIKPPHTGQRYPSLPLWLARREGRFDAIGEELRVLYVALTRAQNLLLLFGKAARNATGTWKERAKRKVLPPLMCKHQSWLDWIGTFAAQERADWADSDSGAFQNFTYQLYREPPRFAQENVAREQRTAEIPVFEYQHRAATRQPAKTSVTTLRQRAEQDDESTHVVIRFRGQKGGTERGKAVHTFLELFRLESAAMELTLRSEAQRLVQEGSLPLAAMNEIDFDAITTFWNSETGAELLRKPADLHRELPFTFKASRSDLLSVGLGENISVPEGEFVLIQGIADLVLLRPTEIWLLDFKTDQLAPGELKKAQERYRPQVLLYALALESIYRRPVTKKGIFFLDPRRFVWF